MRPLFVDFTTAIERLLHQLLTEASIPYVQIEARTKEIPNFIAKLRRKDSKYEEPLAEVTDLAGVRIVLYYLDDVERVGELIEKQFTLDSENSIDKSAALDPDRFGYLSVHHIVRMSSAREGLPEWKRYAGLCAEVQVRTVLQHAWAAISRKLAYASVREAPRDLQRSLNRLSALLELADDQFLDVRSARDAIEEQYDLEVERGNLDLEVDDSSLESYVREAGLEDRVSQLAREAGSPPARDEPDYMLEAQQQGIRDLLVVLRDQGVDRIAELDQRLDDLWEVIPEFMETVNTHYRVEPERPIVDLPLNWLVLVLLWAFEAPPEQFEKLRYAEELVEVITSTYPRS